MKRMMSRKSHSWWWDSHISPKNSKWLAENLQEMDKCVKEMLKLIEEEGDSFAKKAEMYYQRRPELVSHVEDFYRMYRALAERYDNVTGELRRSIPSALQNQGSGSGSEFGSDMPSPCTSPSPKRKQARSKSGPRAAGFDFFLGSGGSSDRSRKESDGSSSSESDSDSEDSKDANGDGSSDEFQQKILELENELCGVKEKLQWYEENKSDEKCELEGNGDCDEFSLRISTLEEELNATNKKLRFSEAEIANLKQNRAEETASSDRISKLQGELAASTKELQISEEEVGTLKQNILEVNASSGRSLELEEELAVAYKKLHASETEIANLKQKLVEMNALKDTEDIELNKERQQVSELRDRIIILEAEISAHKHEVEDLEGEIAGKSKLFEAELSTREHAIDGYKRELANASEGFLIEKSRLEADVRKLEGAIQELKTEIKMLSVEKFQLEASVAMQENVIKELKDMAASSDERFLQEKSVLDAEILGLTESHSSLEAKLATLEESLMCLEAENTELRIGSEKNVTELKKNIEELNLKIEILVSEKEELGGKVIVLTNDVKSRDNKLGQMEMHLHQLHLEHMKLIAEVEDARRAGVELKARVKELESEVDMQRVAILDGAEGKREAIRQLCFSLEHYRSGYIQLRKALQGPKRLPVMAT